MTKVILTIVFILITIPAFSQTLQKNQWITDGIVHTIEVKGDTAYIGGMFNWIGPATGGVAEISKTTGYSNEEFPKVSGAIGLGGVGFVYEIVPDGSGGWFVGGTFDLVNGIPRQNIAHINPDRTLDENWNAGSIQPVPGGYNITSITSIAVYDNTVFIMGVFGQIDGHDRQYLAALDAATGELKDWNPNPDGYLSKVFVINSTLYVGGDFTSIANQSRTYLASFNAETGELTSWNPNINGLTRAFANSDSILYVAGGFSQVNSVGREGLAAFNLTTGNLTSWNPTVYGTIYSLAISGNLVYAGGEFVYIGGVYRNHIASVDAVTGLATNWNPNPFLSSGPALTFISDLVVSDSIVYTIGNFDIIGGESRFMAAALDTSTGNATDWNPSLPSVFNSIWPFTINAINDNVYLGGNIATIGAQAKRRMNLAAIDLTTGLPTDWNPNPYGEGVYGLKLNNDTLYVSGDFSSIGGQTRHYLASVDVLTGNVTNWNPDPNGWTSQIDISGDVLYVGGNFTEIGGQRRNSLAALDLNTGLAANWDPSVGEFNGNPVGWIQTLRVADDNVYVGGYFNKIGEETRNYVAAIDKNKGIPTSWNPNASTAVVSIEASDNTIYLGGFFTTIGGQPRNYLAAVDAATGIATDWNPNPNDYVRAIIASDSTIYVGGDFSIISEEARQSIVAFDKSTGNLKDWNLNVIGGEVRVISFPYSDQKRCMIGGSFRSVLGLPYYSFINVISADSIVSSVNEPMLDSSPAEWYLSQNYPNPFNPSTTISFSVDNKEQVELAVFNVLGQEVAKLFIGVASPGYKYNLRFDGSGLPSGVYFYQVTSNSKQEVKKMLLLK